MGAAVIHNYAYKNVYLYPHHGAQVQGELQIVVRFILTIFIVKQKTTSTYFQFNTCNVKLHQYFLYEL